MDRLVIKTRQRGLTLSLLAWPDAERYYDLLREDRAHLSQFGDLTSKKYPTLESVRDSIVNPPNPRKLRFGIWDRGVFVGMVGLTPRGHGVCETGGWTGKRFCNLGYGSATRRSLAKYALHHLGFRRVIAKTHPGNVPSKNMLLKAGFRLVRRTKKSHYFVFVS